MDEIEDKVRQRIKKLQALAERGVGGEATTARKKIEQLMGKYGIQSLDELAEEKAEYFLFSYNGELEKILLKQCMYKVIGYEHGGREYYHTTGYRQKVGVYCTKAQRIEIELEFDFHKNIFRLEARDFLIAYIRKQELFPEDAPVEHVSTDDLSEEDLKSIMLANAIKKRQRAELIEDKGGSRT